MKSDPRDYKLDISGLEKPKADVNPPTSRPYLSVTFKCCSVYQRIYRSKDGLRYEGKCPKCGLPVNIKVGTGGTSSRFFTVE